MKIGTLASVTNFTNDNSAVAQVNSNSVTITTALNNTVSLDGSAPNVMSGNVDFSGGGRILNLPAPLTVDEPLRLQDLNTFIGGGTITSIPAGGSTGDALVKTSGTDYAVGWSTSPLALTGSGLNQFAATTSSQLASVISDETGSGSLVFATSPTLVTPVLGTPASGTLTNCTIPISGITTLGTGVAAALAAVVTGSGGLALAVSPSFTTPVLGIPTSGTLTNCTGLPISGIASLGTGVATALAAAVSGSGSLAMTTGPVFTTPTLGAATATTVNKVTITTPASAATLTLATGTTLTSTTSTSVGVGQYLATATNDNATAGNIGEYIESVIAAGSAVSIVSGTAKTITSISLTAGDWDLVINGIHIPTGTTSITNLAVCLSTTTNTFDTTAGRFFQNVYSAYVPGAFNLTTSVPSYRFSLSTTTTIFMVALDSFTVSTMSVFGLLRARRVR